ncbi:serine hydrolase [Actinomadura sp. SCN-SB]|uniref:serine hydrolase n=1 Tax=Actinomadura sp. SCN-SB TaxID=3373092 RepID=UPI003752FE72
MRHSLSVAALAGTLVISLAAPAAADPPQERAWRQLRTDLQAVVADAADTGITLSVAATDLSGRYCGASLEAGGDERVKAASVIKLGLLVTLMDKVDRGLLDLDTSVHIPAGSSNIVGGSGTLRDREFPLDITVDELMRLMVQVSDNTATNVLIDVAGGFGVVNSFLAAAGYESLWLGRKMIHPAAPPLQENYITASEVTELITELWKGTLVSRSSSDYILDLMRGQLVNTKYGAVIPREHLANKTGELADVSHDSGVITLPGREIALTTTTAYSGLPQTEVNQYVQETARIAYRFAQSALPGDKGKRPANSYCRGSH